MTSGSQEKEALEKAVEYAQARIDRQKEVLDSFGEQGLRMLRIIFVIVGVIVSATIYLSQGPEPGISVSKTCVIQARQYCTSNIAVLKAGIWSFLISTGLYIATAGTESRGLEDKFTSGDAAVALEENSPLEGYLEYQLQEYQNRITKNEQIISTLESTLAIAGTLMLVSISAFTVFSYTIIESKPIGLLSAILASLIPFLFYFWGKRSMPDSYLEQDRILPKTMEDNQKQESKSTNQDETAKEEKLEEPNQTTPEQS